VKASIKALGKSIYRAQVSAAASPRAAYTRVAAKDVHLPESWFRDAIVACPELVIGPCRQGELVPPDEVWMPWTTEWSFGAGPVDALLVSSHGRPAIVETKLSYNPGNRREVVAQIVDYALSMQEMPLDELPPLPAMPGAPDLEDVHDSLKAGRLLLVIAGDELDVRATRLSESMLASNASSEWDLALVDLNVFRHAEGDSEVLLVPELRGVVIAETRLVVRVQVEGTTPSAKITVERVSSDGESGGESRARLTSVEEFMEQVLRKAPAAHGAVGLIVEALRRAETLAGGRFVFGLQSSTANLYWRAPTGALRRIFGMSERGRFRVWLHYVLSIDREDIASIIRERASPIVTIAPGETSGAVEVGDFNADLIVSVVESVTQAVNQV
jgi:hypothetical protein